MNGSTLRNLGIVLFALIAILVGLQLADSGNESASADGPLFAELKSAVNSIERLSVERNGESPLVVRRDGERWVVDNRDGYPADIGKIRELLIELADAEIVERKTANPERYSALGVRDIDVDGSAGTQLSLSGSDDSFAVILGNSAAGNERYARVVGEAGSVLLDKSLELPASAGDWLVDEILDVPAAEVRSVAVAHADGESILVSKASRDATDFDVAEIPAGRELSYPTVANSIGGALAGLSLEDVRKAGEAEAATVTTVTTFDGLTVTASVFEVSDDERWVAFAATAAASEDGGDTGAASDDADEAGDGAEDTGNAVDVMAQADAVNSRVAGWEYRLPAYKANQLVRRWDDLLKAEESDEE